MYTLKSPKKLFCTFFSSIWPIETKFCFTFLFLWKMHWLHLLLLFTIECYVIRFESIPIFLGRKIKLPLPSYIVIIIHYWSFNDGQLENECHLMVTITLITLIHVARSHHSDQHQFEIPCSCSCHQDYPLLNHH